MAQHEPYGDVPVDPRRPSASRGNKLLVGGALVLVAIQAIRFADGGSVEVGVLVIALVLLVLILGALQWVRTRSSRRLVTRVQALRPEAAVLPCLLSAEGQGTLRALAVPTTGLSGLGGSIVALVAGPASDVDDAIRRLQGARYRADRRTRPLTGDGSVALEVGLLALERAQSKVRATRHGLRPVPGLQTLSASARCADVRPIRRWPRRVAPGGGLCPGRDHHTGPLDAR